MKILNFVQVTKKEVRIEINCAIEKIEELESHMKNFLKNIFHSSVTSPEDIARSAVIGADLSKL